MSAVNNENYVSVRNRFAGRRSEPVNLICENCPTPNIMNYSVPINQLIVLWTSALCARSIKRLFTGSKSV